MFDYRELSVERLLDVAEKDTSKIFAFLSLKVSSQGTEEYLKENIEILALVCISTVILFYKFTQPSMCSS